MHAVNGTSGQISSIMFGVPGDGDDAATTIDGYPMAKKGRGRAGARRQHHGLGRRRHHRRDRLRAHDPGAGADRAELQPGRVLPARAARHHLHRLPRRPRQHLQGHHRRPVRDDAGDRRHGPADRHAAVLRRLPVPVGRAQPRHRRARAVRGSRDDRARRPAAARSRRCRWRRRASPTGSSSRACWRCRGTGGWRCAPRSSARSSA